MTFALVALTLAVFVTIDYYFRRPAQTAREVAVSPLQPLPALEPVWVAGYRLPESLYYHRGHTWVRTVGSDTVLVGMDDFARRLIGPAKAYNLPAVGTLVRQGERAFDAEVGGRCAGFVSPVEGEVLAVNEELRAHPALASDDPFGRGWLFKVRTPSLVANLRNLLSGSLARRWIEDCREGLGLRLMALSGSVLQDGGEPVADFARQLSDDDWRRLVGEFLLI